MTENPAPPSVGLWELVRYFLGRGSFGFGGPIALAGYMQRDLVPRGWITSEEYKEGLAFAQMMPGPSPRSSPCGLSSCAMASWGRHWSESVLFVPPIGSLW